MTISLTSDLEPFVRKKNQGGEFAAADEVVAAGLRRLMDEAVDDDELAGETLDAIEEGSAQLDRGKASRRTRFSRVRAGKTRPTTGLADGPHLPRRHVPACGGRVG